MKKLILPVFVTADDIRLGVCAKPSRCAVARGLKRAAKNRFRDTITSLRVHVFGEDGMHVAFRVKKKQYTFDMYRVPMKVLNFINAFDDVNDKKKVKPITFQFRGVDDAQG